MRGCRLHVTGASGAGTTTLARVIASEWSVPHADVDDYFRVPTSPPYRIKRYGCGDRSPGAERGSPHRLHGLGEWLRRPRVLRAKSSATRTVVVRVAVPGASP